MTIIEQIRAEIERLKKEELTRNSIGVITGSALFVSANELLSFLSTLEKSEKPIIPNDLEEAAKKFVGYDMDCDELRDYEMGIASFIAGYNFCKEQMLKEAVDTTMVEGSLTSPEFVKRRIIIVKEDEK